MDIRQVIKTILVLFFCLMHLVFMACGSKSTESKKGDDGKNNANSSNVADNDGGSAEDAGGSDEENGGGQRNRRWEGGIPDFEGGVPWRREGGFNFDRDASFTPQCDESVTSVAKCKDNTCLVLTEEQLANCVVNCCVDGKCGVRSTSTRRENSECIAIAEEDPRCPSATSSMSGELPGCCTSDNRCGVISITSALAGNDSCLNASRDQTLQRIIPDAVDQSCDGTSDEPAEDGGIEDSGSSGESEDDGGLEDSGSAE